MGKVQTFSDLEAWKKAHALALMTYALTHLFPPREQFGLVNQMRRASVSVTSNIAEGFSRNSAKDKKRFYITAKGSLTELQSQCLLARDLNFLSREDFEKIYEMSVTTDRLISGIIKSASDKQK